MPSRIRYWGVSKYPEKIEISCPKNEFSEVGLPGVENDPTPRGIILHPFLASQLPYIAKSDFSPELEGGVAAPYRGRLL